MKKILSVVLALFIFMSMGLTVFAAPGTFLESPSNNPAPELTEATNESEDCTADVVITGYSDRENLSDELRKQLDDAYGSIASATDLTKLNDDLAKIAKDKNIPGSSLAVSELFDMHYIDCETHDEHGNFIITLKPETLKNFVGLMQYINGEWKLVKNAKVINGNQLSFKVKDLSAMAIVVNPDADKPSTQTGDNSKIIIYIVIMAISAAAIAIIMVRSKKQAN